MIRGYPSCNGTDVRWNQSLLYRVNDFGDPYPNPRYQGWFYHIDDSNYWERFHSNFEGTFETHNFVSGSKGTSPLGAPHFYAPGISEGGMKCHQGD